MERATIVRYLVLLDLCLFLVVELQSPVFMLWPEIGIAYTPNPSLLYSSSTHFVIFVHYL